MATSNPNGVEKEKYSNPCGYDSPTTVSEYSKEQEKKIAQRLANQANYVIDLAKTHSAKIAELHNYKEDCENPELDLSSNYRKMLEEWENTKWLERHKAVNEHFWALPVKKKIGEEISRDLLSRIIHRWNDALPIISKVLKVLAAEFETAKNSPYWDSDAASQEVKANMETTSNSLGTVLCYCHDLILNRNLKMLPLYDSEISTVNSNSETTRLAFLVHRDTLNFLEFLVQVLNEVQTRI